MAELSKISGVAIADVAKVDAVLKADIANFNGLTIPSAAAFLLDTYTGAAAGYSVRRLNSAYTGACMRVRRDSDDTEQDIGFDSNGDLDTTALATFVGSGNNGYVTRWYGQESSGGTGSGNDAENSTSTQQRKIYDATTGVQTYNGKPALYRASFPGGAYTHSMDAGTNWSSFDVVKIDNNQSFGMHVRTSNWFFLADGGSGNYTSYTSAALYKNGSAFTGLSRADLKTFVSTDYQSVAFFGGKSFAARSDWRVCSGYDLNTYYGVRGYVQESIIYNADKSSDRTGIVDNQNTYFSIY